MPEGRDRPTGDTGADRGGTQAQGRRACRPPVACAAGERYSRTSRPAGSHWRKPAESPRARLRVRARRPIRYHGKRPACCNDTPGQDTRRSRACVRLAAIVHRRLLCRVSLTKSAAGRATRGGRTLWAISHRLTTRPIPQPVTRRDGTWTRSGCDRCAGGTARNGPGIRNPCSDRHGSVRLRLRTLLRPLQAETARSASRAPAAAGSRTARKVAWEMRRSWRQGHSLRSGRRRSRIQASLKTRRDRRTSSPACRDRRLQRTTHHGSGGTARPEAR